MSLITLTGMNTPPAKQHPCIALLTDFGVRDPYVGQLKLGLHAAAPGLPVIDLMHAIPDFNPHAAAHLLAAFHVSLPKGTVVCAVVDPGVGGARQAVAVHVEGIWYVGPDNGLFSILVQRGQQVAIYRIDWRPAVLSTTFHGRDLFVPIAARIAQNRAAVAAYPLTPPDGLTPISGLDVSFDPGDLSRVIYIDHYGNAWTGIRGLTMEKADRIGIKGHAIPWAETFCAAGKGELFWYVNSNGLLEIAANRVSAAELLDLKVGDIVQVMPVTGALH